jgi:hypothetical protein
MRNFVFSMLFGVGVATLAAVTAARALLPESTWQQTEASPSATPVATAARGAPQSSKSPDIQAASQGPFTQFEAVEVVAARLGNSAKADHLRHTLRMGAKVEYHSPGHWTVRLNEASWTAHGVGARYADPENDAARLLEQEAARP